MVSWMRIEVALMWSTVPERRIEVVVGRRGLVEGLIRDQDCDEGRVTVWSGICSVFCLWTFVGFGRASTHGATTSPLRPPPSAMVALTAYRRMDLRAAWLWTLPRRAEAQIRGCMLGLMKGRWRPSSTCARIFLCMLFPIYANRGARATNPRLPLFICLSLLRPGVDK
jgi:hypothetical protein